MHGEPRTTDDLHDLGNPGLAGVIDVQSATWLQAAVIGRENERMKDG